MTDFLKESIAALTFLLITMAVCGAFYLLTGTGFVYLLAGAAVYHAGRLDYKMDKDTKH